MSKFTEHEIAIEAVKAVEEYGELSMSELIGILTDRMKPTEHDSRILHNRNDTYFSQKVRNLRSHQNKIFFQNVYYDQSKEKYMSYECKNLRDTLENSAYRERIKRRKKMAQRFYAQKVDYEMINKEKKLIGNSGEEFVYRDQINFVRKYAPEYESSVRHVSKLDGDGAGYDISSFDKDKKIVYIEVKTTTGRKETPFYMSATEYAFFELHKDNYIIARVYDFDKETGTGKIEYLPGAQIEGTFEKEVFSYKIFYK